MEFDTGAELLSAEPESFLCLFSVAKLQFIPHAETSL